LTKRKTPKQPWTLHQVLIDNIYSMDEIAGDFFSLLFMKTPFLPLLPVFSVV